MGELLTTYSACSSPFSLTSFPNSVWEPRSRNSVSSPGPDAKQSFADVRSQTEFGNEAHCDLLVYLVSLLMRIVLVVAARFGRLPACQAGGLEQTLTEHRSAHRRRRTAGGRVGDLEPLIGDPQDIARQQDFRLYLHAVHARAVAAFQIANVPVAVFEFQLAMLPRNDADSNRDVAFGTPTQN